MSHGRLPMTVLAGLRRCVLTALALCCVDSGLENILKGYTRRVDGSQMRLDEPAEKGDEPGPKVFVVAVEVTPRRLPLEAC